MATKDYDKIDTLVKAYFSQAKHTNLNDPTELDMFIVDAVGDWMEGKIDDLTLAHICLELEGEPMHHLMHNGHIVYTGIKLDRYISEENAELLKATQDELKSWYESL